MNRDGGYDLEVPCQYVIEGITLAGSSGLRKRIESERVIVDGVVFSKPAGKDLKKILQIMRL